AVAGVGGVGARPRSPVLLPERDERPGDDRPLGPGPGVAEQEVAAGPARLPLVDDRLQVPGGVEVDQVAGDQFAALETAGLALVREGDLDVDPLVAAGPGADQ